MALVYATYKLFFIALICFDKITFAIFRHCDNESNCSLLYIQPFLIGVMYFIAMLLTILSEYVMSADCGFGVQVFVFRYLFPIAIANSLSYEMFRTIAKQHDIQNRYVDWAEIKPNTGLREGYQQV